MSYVSGFMLGASLGKGIHQMLFGQPARAQQVRRAAQSALRTQRQQNVQPLEPLALVASTPGRRRYRAAKLNSALAKLLEGYLSQLSYLQSVQANPVTGSLLFTFAPADAAKVDALVHWLELTIFAATEVEAAEAFRSGEAARAGKVTRSVRQSARDFSGWIKKKTGDAFDASSLASLLFFLRGVRKIIMTQQYPSGSQMLWWALSLMRGWKTV